MILKIGDPVFGVMDAGIEGCYAEKVKIKAALVAKKPAKLGHAEAAAMALTSLTAIWALEDTARLKRGETILIQGGAGGVAGFAIQLAKHIGATVITTASARNHDYVRSLGAERIIDYQKEDFTKSVSGCDVVFDTVGGEVQARSYEVLKPGGRLVWIAPGAGRLSAAARRCRVVAPARRARPRPSRTHEGALRGGRRLAARDHPLPARRGGRGAPRQRRPPPPRQARADRALSPGASAQKKPARNIGRVLRCRLRAGLDRGLFARYSFAMREDRDAAGQAILCPIRAQHRVVRWQWHEDQIVI